MTNLTKNTTPFGLLDEETQDAFRAYNGPVEFWGGPTEDTWRPKKGEWYGGFTYRAKPLTKPRIPWEYIDTHWNWAVKSSTGGVDMVKFFAEKPIFVGGVWIRDGDDNLDLCDVFDAGTCDWQDSLVGRHGR